VHVVAEPEAASCWHAAHADRKLHRGEACTQSEAIAAAASVVLKTLIRRLNASVDRSKERTPVNRDSRDKKENATSSR